MKKIMWLADNHPPLEKQKQELDRLFGEISVDPTVNSFNNAERILKIYDEGGYDDLVVVLPESVIRRLCELGLRPLRAAMRQIRNREEADLTYQGRHFVFEGFERIGAITIHRIDVHEPPRVRK